MDGDVETWALLSVILSAIVLLTYKMNVNACLKI